MLEAAGYRVTWLRQLPLLYTVEVIHGDASTRLEWVVDSDYRFFPTLRDETFGYVLHPVDLAMNKVMAAAGRQEVRDLIDLVTIHDTILPLGAVIWAAVDKAPGFTPEGLIRGICLWQMPYGNQRLLETHHRFSESRACKRLCSGQ